MVPWVNWIDKGLGEQESLGKKKVLRYMISSTSSHPWPKLISSFWPIFCFQVITLQNQWHFHLLWSLHLVRHSSRRFNDPNLHTAWKKDVGIVIFRIEIPNYHPSWYLEIMLDIKDVDARPGYQIKGRISSLVLTQ
jgi:hypothetical protein